MRESFVFYASWMDAIQELPTVELRNEAMAAVLQYGLYMSLDQEWEQINPFVRVILKLICPVVDKNWHQYENAKKGGRPRKEESVEKEVMAEKPISKPVSETENPPHINNVDVYVNDNVNENSLSKVSVVSAEQLLKASEPISVRLAGRVIEVK